MFHRYTPSKLVVTCSIMTPRIPTTLWQYHGYGNWAKPTPIEISLGGKYINMISVYSTWTAARCGPCSLSKLQVLGISETRGDLQGGMSNGMLVGNPKDGPSTFTVDLGEFVEVYDCVEIISLKFFVWISNPFQRCINSACTCKFPKLHL